MGVEGPTLEKVRRPRRTPIFMVPQQHHPALLFASAPPLVSCEPGPSPTTTTPGPQLATLSRTPTALLSPQRTPTATSAKPSVPTRKSAASSPSHAPLSSTTRTAVTSTPGPTRPSTTASPTSSTTSATVTPRATASPRPAAAAFRPASTPSTPAPSTPSPEQLVARIRALVRALRDADQLLRALQMFREQQQIGDDAVLRVMKEDANRTLVEQVEHAMRSDKASTAVSMADIMRNLSTAPLPGPSPNKTLSAKIPYSAYGKKSAKFVNGQQEASAAAGKPVAAVGKPRSGVAAAASVAASVARAKAPAKKPLGPAPTARKPSAPASSKKTLQSTTLAPAGFSARTTYVSSKNGTVITRIKNDPILGEYKVVIRDLTPAASSGIGPHNASSSASSLHASSRRSDNASLASPPRVLLPPATSTPATGERGQRRSQPQGASHPSTPAGKSSTPAASTPPPANRRSGKSSSPKTTSSTARAKPRNASQKGKTTTTTTTTRPPPASIPSTLSTTPTPAGGTSSPANTKGLQKKATDRQQIVVSATLRTAPPKEREEEAARERAPQDTPLLSGIFPRYGPGADLPHVERPFVPTRTGAGAAPPPASVLLPPLPDAPVSTTTVAPATTSGFALPSLSSPSSTSAPRSSTLPPTPQTAAPTSSPPAARGDARSAAASGSIAGPPQAVRLEPLEPALSPSPPEVPVSYFLGESPWIPIFVPPAKNDVTQNQSGSGAPAAKSAPPRTIVELTKLHVVEATPSPALLPSRSGPGGLQGRAVTSDALEWRPSRPWQYAVRQDRTDAGELQDLDRDAAAQQHLHDLQHLQLQLQPDLRLGGLSLVPVPLSVAESVYYRLTHVRSPGPAPADLQGAAANTFPYEGIPGVAGVDYPAHSRPPVTRFTCADFRRKGYFADPASGCQAFYVCHGDGRGEAMLCPNGTIFSQEVLVCDWWFNVDCKYSSPPGPPRPPSPCSSHCSDEYAAPLAYQ
ncbi:U-scoloptoxin(01)-Cw1a [Frankliniella fusca]|uniref:U-scoloptoxin(01)-Cw1a n=1 Tax=Frankliniella fusca TaxID=407009 RepID=A0AAE1HQN9_9NEOP|nr:U-scoloptoxin(01)-Cw1a [Frankliniella fusca]